MPNKNPFYTDSIKMKNVLTNQPVVDGEIKYVDGTGFRFRQEGTIYTFQTSSSGGAATSLNNLAAVAINTSLISDADSTDDLGSTSKYWKDTYSDRVLLNSTAILSGATAGTAALTGTLTVSADLTVAVDTTLTGDLQCGGDCNVDGAFTTASFAADALAASTAATDLTLDGKTTGGVDICSISTGGINLGDDVVVATGKTFTVTNGACEITAGALTMTAGNLIMTDGNIAMAEGKLTIDSSADDQSYIKRNKAATTGALFELEETNAAADNETLLIDSNATGAVGSVVIDHEGTADAITLTSLAAGASLIKATSEATTGTVLEAICAASTTTPQVLLDGTTGDWIGADGVGQLEITCDGALAHANASCLLIEYSGTGAATGLGTSLRIVDTGATATSTAVYISAATGEAMRIDAGTVIFDESLTVGTTFVSTGEATFTAGINGTEIRAGTGITTSTGAAAVAVTGAIHEVTTSGIGDALTLANGTAGQKITVIYVAEGGGTDTAILTPTTLAGGATITFNALGDSADLTYSATGGWYMTGGTAVIAA